MRLNITIPDEIGKLLDSVPNKSRFIAQALKEKFEADKRKTLEREMAEGYAYYGKNPELEMEDWSDTLNDGDWDGE